MDPDGLSILIATASTFGALAAAYRAGAVSASEPERQQSGILGFSDRMAGLCAAFVFACGFFVYGFLRIFAQAPWWTLLCLAALAALAVLLYSLGRAKGRIKEKSGFTAACMLGAPLAAPAKLVFKALGLSAQSDVTEEDVLSFVDDVEEHDLIDESQKKMITNIFELDDVTAGDVMTHRTEIVSVEENTPAADAVRLSLEHGFSRLPVYRKSLDDIVGILYVKDLFALWDTPEKAQAPVSRFMRGAMFVPEACRAQELLVDFKVKHTQIAVVVDEYGGTSGIITMEDLLEELVGNIYDEFDPQEDQEIVPLGENLWRVAGSAELEELAEALDVEFPEEEEAETLGGLVFARLDVIPADGSHPVVEADGLRIEVEELADRRVEWAKVSKLQPAEEHTGKSNKEAGS